MILSLAFSSLLLGGGVSQKPRVDSKPRSPIKKYGFRGLRETYRLGASREARIVFEDSMSDSDGRLGLEATDGLWES